MTDWTPPQPLPESTDVYGYLLDLFEPPAWYAKAACMGLSGLFFAQHDETSDTKEAKKVCATCPVIDDCRDLAAVIPATWPGVYAGLSQAERRAMRRKDVA